MRLPVRFVVVSWLIVLAAGRVVAEDAPAMPTPASKATLAVVPFQARADILASRRSEVQTVEDALIRTFVATNKFDVIERAKMEAVVNEHDFATSSFGDPANAARLGKLLGAQYLVVGNVHELGTSVVHGDIPYVDETTCTATARLRIEMRVVRTETGKIVAAHMADSDTIGAKGQACGTSPQAALVKALDRVAQFLVGKTIDLVYPIRVVHVGGDEITLNRGEGGDFVVGATLECFTQGEAIVDPDTGETLGNQETPVGKVTVEQVMPKLSRARAVDAAIVPAQAVCRVTSRAPVPKPVKRAPRPHVNF
jgi:TolB-like protein